MPRYQRLRSWTGLLLPIGLAGGCTPPVTRLEVLQPVRQELVQADSSERLFSVVFANTRGDTVQAYLRLPTGERMAGGKVPGVVLVAGRETGRQAASVIPGPLEVAVLAVEYPEVFPEGLDLGTLLQRLPGIRRSASAMPGILRGAARFLAGMPEVDSARIALVGVSFGVPFATPAGADSIFRGVALHFGGGGLPLLFRTNLPVRNRLLRGLTAGFLAWYFRELEPARHVGRISPTPLLLINGLYDQQVPREAALRLARAAGPPVRQIWLPEDHLMPDELEVMRELADSTLSHFPFLRREAPRTGVMDPLPGGSHVPHVDLVRLHTERADSVAVHL
ncbi:MAG TPA: hypothetical protein VF167_16945 [Longimicrobiaceae bacterium]